MEWTKLNKFEKREQSIAEHNRWQLWIYFKIHFFLTKEYKKY